MTTNQVTDLLKRAEILQGQRSNFETAWQDVAEVFRPIKSDITVERSKGEKDHINRLYESFPITAVSTLKSIVIGVFFNRSIKPISITSSDEELNEDKEVSEWLTDFTDMMLKNIFDPKSGFERSLSELVNDDIVFGTGGTFIEKGSKFTINYHTLNIKNILVAESKEGDVDYVVIKTKKTARQIMEEWQVKAQKGEARIHENIIKANDKNPFEEFNLQLHILPREGAKEGKIDRLSKPIAGFWIDEKHKIIIEETGWDSMPISISRSEKATNESYGTSRAMMALADARQINQMSKQINEAVELSLRPPLNINANYSDPLNLRSGAGNYPVQESLRSGIKPVEPILTVGNIPLGEDLINRKQENIKETFFLDKLKIFDNPNATATQVLELRAESFRIMGDFISGLIEYMNQLLTRSFDVFFRQIYDLNNQLIPDNPLFNKELPQALLANPDLKINYVNPITQSQRLSESTSIDKFLEDVANIAQFKPEVLDLINVDEVVKKKREVLNIDAELLNSASVVEDIRAQRQEQEQQEQELSDAERLTQSAATANQSGLV